MTNIYFQTHGCSTNLSESEVMMGLLSKVKFGIVSEPEKADILVVNICTVKGEETALRVIRKISEEFPNKKLVVAGCLTKIILKEARKIREDVSFISTHNIKSIVDVIEEVLHDNVIEATGRDEYKKINLPKIRNNPIVGIIPILNGCANYCSYCSVKYVKGKLLSYDAKDIKFEASKCLTNGCKEIWVTSQDNAAYMLEKEKISKLPELVDGIANLEGDFFIRVGMMNPTHLLDILEPMIKAYKNDKVFKFLHVPVQSGNNDILKLMKRNYNVDDFRRIVEEFRKNVPNITISTDIIAGFPTETEEQFNDSLELIKEIKPDVLNISRFQARNGTEAYKLKGQIHGRETKDRSRMLTEIYTNIARMNNEKWINWKGEVLIDEKGKNDTFVGRNFSYRPVIVRGDYRLGDYVKVKIDNVTSFDLRSIPS
ncbi:MAG: tRNA (N(6)-L-threonylcarbamoyladenosine(37)-C(2))-methylthiotransferase [Nanoarchaeota archaeon]|nr:tRNA (N(6)-L-threonylcarbamoyladenosine(37)-C(2))-methylthiotransferase [Nanoarchaeota archaeon]